MVKGADMEGRKWGAGDCPFISIHCLDLSI